MDILPHRQELRDSWERQQSIHAPFREERFKVMLDHAESLAGPPRRALDLACGPGSLTRRIRSRFPTAEIVALDIDPLLLDLARDEFAGDDRVVVVERQLASADWTEGLGAGYDVVLTSLAMHWLPEAVLADVYAGVSRILRSGGVFANADHMPIAEPVLSRVADSMHEKHLSTAFGAGAESCDDWYVRAYADAAYAGWWERRQKAFRHWSGDLLERGEWHVDLLRKKGFERAGIVWRHGNDAIVVAVNGSGSARGGR
jgi:SAM-dependent methyltransferase